MSWDETRSGWGAWIREGGRWALLLLALLPLMPPLRGETPPTWALGEVAPRSVVAEFDFPVLRDRSEFEAELRRLRGEIPAILAVVDSARLGTRDRLFDLRERVETLRSTWDADGPDSLEFGYDPETSIALVLGGKGPKILEMIEDLGAEVERRGYVSAELGRELEPFHSVTVVGAGEPVHVSRERILTPSSLRDSATVVARERGLPLGSTLALTKALFTPNLTWREGGTEGLLERAEAGLPRHRRFVRRGERIVGANEVVSASTALALESYSFWWGNEERDGPGPHAAFDRGARLLLGLVTVVLVFALLEARGEPRRPRGGLGERTLFTLIVGFALGISALLRLADLSWLLFPAAGVSLAASLLLGRRRGLLGGLLFVTLVALPGGAGFAVWSVLLAGAFVTAWLPVREPRELGRSALLSGILQALVLLGLLGAGLTAPERLVPELVTAALGPFLGSALAWAAVTTVERRARWATPLGMGELTALDHPLLARLQAEAPGTYAHSVRVATLADAAARAIGADGRLARAIGYHHDVGKLARPGDFPENGGEYASPERERLLREMHVREGVALAEEARLPREVVAGIGEHHGDELGPTGARPSFPESAVVLVANRAVRAAASGQGGTAEDLEQCLTSESLLGELEGSGLRLGDLRRIREETIGILRTWDRSAGSPSHE